VIFEAPGIVVKAPDPVQILAMKLCAWRDDVDVSDAARLLKEIPGDQNKVWERVSGFLVPGRELKAEYAFIDLWESKR